MDADARGLLMAEYGLTDEQIDELIEAGVLVADVGTTGREMDYYEGLANTRTPHGRGYGGVYESAHPLEFLGSGMQQMAGHYGRFKEKQEETAAQKELAELRKLFMQKRSPAPTPGTPPIYDPGVVVRGPR